MTPKLSLLTGQPAPPRAPKPAPKPDRLDVLTEQMSGMLTYLHTDAKKRAQAEAQPIVEATQRETAAQIEAMKAESATALQSAQSAIAERESQLTQLRELLNETDTNTAGLQKELRQRTRELSKMNKAMAAREQAAAAQIADLTARLETMPAVQPASEPAPPLKPEQIQFDWQRGGSGLVNSVVLRADGYDDVTINVERFPDNRIRNLLMKGAGHE